MVHATRDNLKKAWIGKERDKKGFRVGKVEWKRIKDSGYCGYVGTMMDCGTYDTICCFGHSRVVRHSDVVLDMQVRYE